MPSYPPVGDLYQFCKSFNTRLRVFPDGATRWSGPTEHNDREHKDDVEPSLLLNSLGMTSRRA